MEPNFVPRDSLDMDSHQVSAGFVELLMNVVIIFHAHSTALKPGVVVAESLCGWPGLV